MPRVAVMTSGGDAPGMNAAIRAVVRGAAGHGISVLGVQHGYAGLLRGDFRPLGLRDVGGILHRGGTLLGTSRCEAMRGRDGQAQAVDALNSHAIDALIVIGGNGSQSGAHALSRHGVRVVGIASTIDNDLYGADVTIGATTAVDVALEAIDRLRVTAAATQRAFLVEVMGRSCGYLALMAGITGGAEAIVVPEAELAAADIAGELAAGYARGKSHAIAVIAEGAQVGVDALLAYFNAEPTRYGFDVRVTRLGHVQRGGAPGAFDRMMGSELGLAAVETINAGTCGVLVGMVEGRPLRTPLAEVAGRTRPADPRLVTMARLLAA
jgi:6-phosphofructokinase 1